MRRGVVDKKNTLRHYGDPVKKKIHAPARNAPTRGASPEK